MRPLSFVKTVSVSADYHQANEKRMQTQLSAGSVLRLMHTVCSVESTPLLLRVHHCPRPQHPKLSGKVIAKEREEGWQWGRGEEEAARRDTTDPSLVNRPSRPLVSQQS